MSNQMNRLIKVGEAATILGVTVQTLRRWERSGQLLPDKKCIGFQELYIVLEVIKGIEKIPVNQINLIYRDLYLGELRECKERARMGISVFFSLNNY